LFGFGLIGSAKTFFDFQKNQKGMRGHGGLSLTCISRGLWNRARFAGAWCGGSGRVLIRIPASWLDDKQISSGGCGFFDGPDQCWGHALIHGMMAARRQRRLRGKKPLEPASSSTKGNGDGRWRGRSQERWCSAARQKQAQ